MKQILYARVVNGGQQCISPDYILIEKEVFQQFKDRAIHYVKEWYKTDFL